jgi:hypothetical protein
MSRKPFVPKIPTQFKHLRFLDTDSSDIMNNGGYSLAYRLILDDANDAVKVQYAFSEVNLTDNFNRSEGRRRTYNRLNCLSPDHTGEFVLGLNELGVDFKTRIIDLGSGFIDVRNSEFDIAKAVIMNFLQDWEDCLTLGIEGVDLSGNLVENALGIFIDSVALDALDEEDEDIGDYEALSETLTAAEEGLLLIENFTDPDNVFQVNSLLKDLAEKFNAIKSAAHNAGVNHDPDDLDEEEGDEAQG